MLRSAVTPSLSFIGLLTSLWARLFGKYCEIVEPDKQAVTSFELQCHCFRFRPGHNDRLRSLTLRSFGGEVVGCLARFACSTSGGLKPDTQSLISPYKTCLLNDPTCETGMTRRQRLCLAQRNVFRAKDKLDQLAFSKPFRLHSHGFLRGSNLIIISSHFFFNNVGGTEKGCDILSGWIVVNLSRRPNLFDVAHIDYCDAIPQFQCFFLVVGNK